MVVILVVEAHQAIGNMPTWIDNKVYDNWKAKNTTPYEVAIFVYAEKWANLMEAALAEGKSIVDVADKTSHQADEEGITGFMYGAAVSILSQCWEHGEELRKWHNKEHNQPDAKGVVNPALVTVSLHKG